MATIRNPIEWTGAQLASAAHAAEVVGRSVEHMRETAHSPAPTVRKIGTSDIWRSLREGFSDFEAYRSDVIFLCATYAIIGLVLARLAFGSDLLPLVFPLASGFAIIGPLAAVGLYEMSRLREQGAEVGWSNAFDVIKAPAIGGIAAMGAILIAFFLLWLGAAWAIFQATLAPILPREPSASVFAQAVLDMTIGYTKLREQFGKLIGSFQALQHRMVDCYVDAELNRSLLYKVLSAWDEDRSHPAMVSAVKARVGKGALKTVRAALQLHGAIGYTDEHDIGIYYKRAVALAAKYGNEITHVGRFSDLTLPAQRAAE